ncbi:MAG TPA: 4-alpha-glucanotransferase [Terriglobales bacterium]|nr:4-alpha-glucanotransferase [Terriglobales bacterium]
MEFERSAGILLHPTSLPSRGGIGDFGPAAYAFVDFLEQSKHSLWQILPLSPVGFGYSPYSATSAFAGNPLLISLELLVERGWASQGPLQSLAHNKSRIDYEQVIAFKMPLLAQAARAFLEDSANGQLEAFQSFCTENEWWLEDFALFTGIRNHQNSHSWNEWPRPLASRDPAALDEARKQLANEMEIERVLQFFFFEQWNSLRKHCAARKVKVIGDVAIFVNFDSADVWRNQEIFLINDALQPVSVAGVPPDAFSSTGQRWGNPLYRWDVLKERGYSWWIQRLKWAVTICDYVRLDHFRGFEQYWEIPAHEPTAINGHWVDGPKDDLFHALRESLGDLPFIAEDLGMITHSVIELRDRLGIPGMKVLQFAFGDKGAHVYLPHNYETNSVVYTGTHDNETSAGWFKALPEGVRNAVLAYVGEPKDGIHWGLIRAAHASNAVLSIVPLQDVLGLGNEARMNTPSVVAGNWGWRYSPSALTSEISHKLAALADVTDRLPR